jgi:hypothetical protein
MLILTYIKWLCRHDSVVDASFAKTGCNAPDLRSIETACTPLFLSCFDQDIKKKMWEDLMMFQMILL